MKKVRLVNLVQFSSVFLWVVISITSTHTAYSLCTRNAPQVEFDVPQDAAAQGNEDVKPIDKDLQRKVRLLQRQLNSDETQQRNVAEQELLGLGENVLDYLADEDPSYSAEFNSRLRNIRTSLELEVATSIIKPKTVSLNGSYTLTEVAAELSRQTGNVVVSDPSEQENKIELNGVSFLEALDQLSKEATCSYQLVSGRVNLIPSPAPQVSRHVDYSQGFRASATSIRAYRNLDTDLSTTNLALRLQWEPRLRIIKLMIPIGDMTVLPAGSAKPESIGEDTEAEEQNFPEENSNVSNSGSLEFGVSRGETESSFELPIPSQPDEVKAVDVYGHFTGLIAGRNELFRFNDLTKALENKSEIQRSGIKVKMVGRQDDEYLTGFQLSISFTDAKKSLESHFGWVYENPVYLVDPEGVRHASLTVESAGVDDNTTSMLFLFDKLEDPEGWSLEYHSPGILVETKVPFELKGIRLP